MDLYTRFEIVNHTKAYKTKKPFLHFINNKNRRDGKGNGK